MFRLNPLNDFIFQKLFGEKGDEEQLLSLLNAILYPTLGSKLVSLEISEHTRLVADIIGNKTGILDIMAFTDDNTWINVEVQLRDSGNMERRSLFYCSCSYSRFLQAGQDYSELPKVISINIVDFECNPLEDFHTIFHIWEDSNRYKLTDALEIHFIDLTKFVKLAKKDLKNDPLHRWLTYFCQNIPDHTLQEVIKMDSTIKKTDEKMKFISQDNQTLRMYLLHDMALSDQTSFINQAKRKGLAEGIEEGRKEGIQEGKMKIAEKLLISGMTIKEVASLTELGLPVVSDIHSKLDID